MRFAVIDVETTGFGRSDRIVEASVVILDERLEPIEEFDSLVNPRRDVGPTSIHGITATMVSSAPAFEDVAGVLAAHLTDAVLVAHNLSFDTRMLQQEFARLGGELQPGVGFDTLGPTGCALDAACARLGVPLDGHHRALADARATAGLLRGLREPDDVLSPALVLGAPAAATLRTLRREAVQAMDVRRLGRLRPPLRYPTGEEHALSYLHALNWMLDDAVIDDLERRQLDELARDLGLDPVRLTQLHSHYLRHLIDAVTKDGVVTLEERTLLERVATALGVDWGFLPERSEVPPSAEILPGTRVCFTGDAEHRSREELEAAAALVGFQPVSSVTRKACDLLVAADPASQSGKAAKARQYGIPVVAISAFVTQIGLGLP